MKGKLYVVATPIGNLGDMTARAVETLESVHAICAEDTRRTRQLLSHFGVPAKNLTSLHAHSTDADVKRAIDMLEEGHDVAVVTDAGTPIVSDPGEALVRVAIAREISVVPIPGASAVLAALMSSGLSENGFRFMGFLPRSGPPRHAAIAMAAETPETVVLFESPNRVQNTLHDLAQIMPNREVCVARELTKMHEEMIRGRLSELASDDREWIGEIVIVLGGFSPETRAETIDLAAIDTRIDEELAAGGHAKSIAEKVAAWSGRPKRDVYARVLERKRG
ncbi:MAG: 16S rRNA (cytidine(1402)-2'-O)-methyltransferase [Polyangiaceae bacterium]